MDYKKEIHRNFTNALDKMEKFHHQSVAKMQVVSEQYLQEIHQRNVQTTILNQSLEGLSDIDQLQQKVH